MNQIEWQSMISQLENIANDPKETAERRSKARRALDKAGQGSLVRGSFSSAWADRQKNNHGSGTKHYGGTA